MSETHILVRLDDGREIATPISWYPAIMKAEPAALQSFVLSPFGIHWPEIDEDLSVRGMLSGIVSKPDGNKSSVRDVSHPINTPVDLVMIARGNGQVDIELVNTQE